jgi:hypothetical protein
MAFLGFLSGCQENSSPLIGSWVRPDGGYELRVLAVERDGSARVEYYNPQPVHVAEAKVGEDNGAPTLYVKLQGENYPGSNYHLKLEGDRLVGQYFQATSGQTYEIYFQRTE